MALRAALPDGGPCVGRDSRAARYVDSELNGRSRECSSTLHCSRAPQPLLREARSCPAHNLQNPDNRPQPFVQWVHPYTRLSNAVCRPTQLLEWAEQLMHALAPDARAHVVDSMLAQLYAAGGSLLKHRDEDLSWGIGVSLGSTATFECLPAGGEARRILVRSGDVIVGEFGQMPHAVQVASGTDRARPAWWKAIDSFGTKQRCNVLFRQALSEELQRQLAEQRARELYGMDLEELRERTGKDDAFLSVHLRHASLE